MLTRRSRAREVCLQLLFQFDFNSTVEPAVIENFMSGRLHDAASAAYCRDLYSGVVEQRTAIDQLLTDVAENWRLPRMAAVDRNILRLGAFELLFRPDVPVPAALNEAVELARRFGNKDSTAFVNGILDKIAQIAQARSTQASADASSPAAGGLDPAPIS